MAEALGKALANKAIDDREEHFLCYLFDLPTDVRKKAVKGAMYEFISEGKANYASALGKSFVVETERERLLEIANKELSEGKVSRALKIYDFLKEKIPREELIKIGDERLRNDAVLDASTAYNSAGLTISEEIDKIKSRINQLLQQKKYPSVNTLLAWYSFQGKKEIYEKVGDALLGTKDFSEAVEAYWKSENREKMIDAANKALSEKADIKLFVKTYKRVELEIPKERISMISDKSLEKDNLRGTLEVLVEMENDELLAHVGERLL